MFITLLPYIKDKVIGLVVASRVPVHLSYWTIQSQYRMPVPGKITAPGEVTILPIKASP